MTDEPDPPFGALFPALAVACFTAGGLYADVIGTTVAVPLLGLAVVVMLCALAWYLARLRPY